MAEGKGICKYIIVQYQTHLSLTILMFCQKRSCFQLRWCWKNLPSELCPRWRVQSNNHCLVLAFIRSHLRDDNDQCGVDRVFPAWRISYSCDADDVLCSFCFRPRDESSLLWVTLTTEHTFTFHRRMSKHCFGGDCSVGCDDRVDDGNGQDMFCFVRLKKDQGWSVDKGKACHNRRLSGTPHGCLVIYWWRWWWRWWQFWWYAITDEHKMCF